MRAEISNNTRLVKPFHNVPEQLLAWAYRRVHNDRYDDGPRFDESRNRRIENAEIGNSVLP